MKHRLPRKLKKQMKAIFEFLGCDLSRGIDWSCTRSINVSRDNKYVTFTRIT